MPGGVNYKKPKKSTGSKSSFKKVTVKTKAQVEAEKKALREKKKAIAKNKAVEKSKSAVKPVDKKKPPTKPVAKREIRAKLGEPIHNDTQKYRTMKGLGMVKSNFIDEYSSDEGYKRQAIKKLGLGDGNTYTQPKKPLTKSQKEAVTKKALEMKKADSYEVKSKKRQAVKAKQKEVYKNKAIEKAKTAKKPIVVKKRKVSKK